MKKILLAASVALALCSTSAFAGMTQQSGVYGTILGGWSFASSPTTSTAHARSSSSQNYTWGGNLGYQYAFTQNWAAGVELGYTSFGKTNYTYTSSTGSLANSGAQVMAVGSYMMSNGFNAFVKGGAMEEYTKTTSPTQTRLKSGDSAAQWLPAAAAGIGYMPLQNFNVALQYEHTFGSNWNNAPATQSKPMTQNALTVNLTYVLPLSF